MLVLMNRRWSLLRLTHHFVYDLCINMEFIGTFINKIIYVFLMDLRESHNHIQIFNTRINSVAHKCAHKQIPYPHIN